VDGGSGMVCGAGLRSPRIEACTGMEVGRISGKGFGVTEPGKAQRCGSLS